VCCTPTLPDHPVHFTCRDCLDEHTRRAALQLPPSGDGEENEAERARMMRQRMMRQGHICCPLAPHECEAASFSEAALARALSPETFMAYMASRQQLTEQRLAKESEARMQELLQAEIVRLRALDERERAVLQLTEAIAKRLNLCCPHCGAVFLDFQGCCALFCSRCPGFFCAWCLHPSNASDENHRHVAACSKKPSGVNDPYYPGEHWAPFLRARNKEIVLDGLAEAQDLAGDVYEKLYPLIAELGIPRPGLDGMNEAGPSGDAMDLV